MGQQPRKRAAQLRKEREEKERIRKAEELRQAKLAELKDVREALKRAIATAEEASK